MKAAIHSDGTRRSRCWRASLIAVLIAGFGSSIIASPPNVTLTRDRMIIRGVTPGSSFVLLSVAHEPGYYMTRVVSRRELLADDGHTGTIEYALPSGVAFRSIWIVTDLQTGESTVAAPEGYMPLVMMQRGRGRGSVLSVIGSILDLGREEADIVIVRPGRGAWQITVRGTGTEPPVTAGRPRVDVGKLKPLRADFGAGPAALVPGDVLMMIDPEQMDYFLTTIAPGGH